MVRRISQVFLTGAALMALTVFSPYAMAQDDTTKAKPTVKGEMKEGGKEMGKAGKSLGSNVKRGRVVRGGKHFGKHVAHGSKNIAKGTVRGTKKVGKTVKKAVTP
jgi:hypothetical protein